MPNEKLPLDTKSWSHGNTPAQYGEVTFTGLFSPRQLLGHGTSVEVFREMLEEEQANGALIEPCRAAFCYLSLSLDKLRDYNSRQVSWHANREVMDHTFRQHAFPSRWSYAEMAPLIVGLGYDWAIRQTGKCIQELIQLTRPDLVNSGAKSARQSSLSLTSFSPPKVEITCKSGDALDHLADSSVDAVVMDPPYTYANVMYAELSDFFYVWLKRTAGYVYPEWFRRPLTDKDNEAVANVAKFKDQRAPQARRARLSEPDGRDLRRMPTGAEA